MNFSTLSAHAEDFLALKRAVSKGRSLSQRPGWKEPKTQRKTPSEFHCLLARLRMSVADPVLFGCRLDCCRIPP